VAQALKKHEQDMQQDMNKYFAHLGHLGHLLSPPGISCPGGHLRLGHLGHLQLGLRLGLGRLRSLLPLRLKKNSRGRAQEKKGYHTGPGLIPAPQELRPLGLHSFVS
jgi:hypothetical protein